MNRVQSMLAGMLILFAAMPVTQAASKDAQELMALMQKRAPLECELIRLYKEVAVANKAGEQDKVKALTKQMHAVDDKLRPDSARVQELNKRVRDTPDQKAILEQQLKSDKACQY